MCEKDLEVDVEELKGEILGGISHSLAAACPVAVPDKQHKPWVNQELRKLFLSQRNKSGGELQEIRRFVRRKHNHNYSTHTMMEKVSL